PVGDQSLFRLDSDRPVSAGAENRDRTRHSSEEPFGMNSLLIFENVSIAETAESDRPSFQARLFSMPGRLWSSLVLGHQNRRAIADLSALDDRMLKDIGVSRGQIVRAVRDGRDGW
ncbi:MAG: DUF1127 domain-containing protein, partial [Hypericibacter sp.]